jgi:hypothetical protein
VAAAENLVTGTVHVPDTVPDTLAAEFAGAA